MSKLKQEIIDYSTKYFDSQESYNCLRKVVEDRLLSYNKNAINNNADLGAVLLKNYSETGVFLAFDKENQQFTLLDKIFEDVAIILGFTIENLIIKNSKKSYAILFSFTQLCCILKEVLGCENESRWCAVEKKLSITIFKKGQHICIVLKSKFLNKYQHKRNVEEANTKELGFSIEQNKKTKNWELILQFPVSNEKEPLLTPTEEGICGNILPFPKPL